MAKKPTKKAARKAPKGPQESVAGNVAEYIGASLADLMNRKDALVRQLGDVDRQIASVRDMGARLASAVPRFVGLTQQTGAGKKRSAKKTGNRKLKRPLPPDDPLVKATTRTRLAEAKGRATKRARTTQRSGNR